MSYTITIIIIVLIGFLVIVFLVWKNKQDEKLLNPDAEVSIKETMMDQVNRKERI